MATDTDVVALANMIRTRARRLEREAAALKQLAARLLDTVEQSDTSKEDTDGNEAERNGHALATVR